jgi:Ca-activated chloride channel family protein
MDAARLRPEASPATQHEHQQQRATGTSGECSRDWGRRLEAGAVSRGWCCWWLARTALRWGVLPRGLRFAVIALFLAGAVVAARQSPAFRNERPFASGIELTSVTATVTDAEGHLVTGLSRDAFELFEDGERQQITQFTRDRVPIGLGVLLDISDSMYGRRIVDARAAVDKFLFGLLDPADEFFLVAFNHKARPQTGWTQSQAEVQRALAALTPSGGTAIYDAIVSSMPLVEHRNRARAALLVISDGADTASTATLRDIRAALLQTDAFVYAIAIDSPERQPINTRVNAQALREITAESGGRTEIVRNSSDLTDATTRIAEELNSQYVVGYTSTHGADGKFHSIRLRAESSGGPYRVRSRNGYIATPARRPTPNS